MFLNLILLNSIFQSSNLILAHDLERYSCDFLVTNDDDFPSCEMMEERGCYQHNVSRFDEVYYDSENKYGTANIIISSNVTKIKEYAFRDCFAIANVSFEEPSSLKVIGDNAFDGCYSIKSITIPSSVEIIGDYAFPYTNRFSHIYFENDTNIKKIGYCALSSYVVIPLSIENKVIKIIESAIENCLEFFNNNGNSSYEKPIVNNTNLEYENYTKVNNDVDYFLNDNIDDIINDDLFNEKLFNDESYMDYNTSQFYNNKYEFTNLNYTVELQTNTSQDILLDIIPDDITNTNNSYNVYLNFSKLYAYIVSFIQVFNFTNTVDGSFMSLYQKYGTISFNNATGIFWLHTNTTSYSISQLLA
jgi:BspA type Leucine rich repeat region (6 copies)